MKEINRLENNEKIHFSKLLSEMKKGIIESKCLCPRKTDCSGNIVKAHSIQNNRILNKISTNGYVIQFKMEDIMYTYDASKIGKKMA